MLKLISKQEFLHKKNPKTGLTMPEKNIQELLGIKNSTEFASML